MERLQKIISAAGVASRRKAEELITSGLVQVNGQTVTELGAKADASKDHIRVNGKLIKFSGHHVYILLNKPKGYVTTLSDPEGRPTIVDLLHGVKQRVYPVGRLDYASEGLLLLTNDGEMANALTKAASHVPKTYLVKVDGQPSDAAIEQLRAGIELPDRKGIHSRTAPAGIKLVHKAANPWYEVTLIEGRNRQVRVMFEQTGHHVEKLKRVRYGPFTLDVHPGKHRNLLPEEVDQLRTAINRGASASAEESVRPAAHAESYIEAALREEERTPAKVTAALVQVAAKRVFKDRAEFSKPDGARAGGFRAKASGGDFRKKRPQASTFRRDGDRPFQKQSDGDGPRPARPFSGGERPAWKKPSAPSGGRSGSASGRGNQGAPARFGKPPARDQQRPDSFRPSAGRGKDDGDARASRPGAGQPDSRPFERKSGFDRPARSGPRPDWKKPSSFRSGAPKSLGPKKWSNNAPSPKARAAAVDRTKIDRTSFDRSKTEQSKTEGFSRNAGTTRPSGDGPTSRPFKPRFKDERGFGSREARPDAKFGAKTGAKPGARPARPGADSPQPFWKSADKRRPRKEAAESEFETRPVERDTRPSSGRSARPKFAPSKASASRSRTPGFKASGFKKPSFSKSGSKPSRPNKNRR
jgi:23S rRNA pseudouridine2605 synthase